MRLLATFFIAASISIFAATPESEVKDLLAKQSAAWNQGNLEEFVKYYSEESIFVGKKISRGNAQVLEGYKRRYSTREKMGTLVFSDLEVRMLAADYASVIGHFHLERTAGGGGNSDGVFTLLFRKTSSGWKIILDHTS